MSGLIIVVLLIVLIVAGFFLWRKHKEMAAELSEKNAENQQLSASVASKSAEIAEMKGLLKEQMRQRNRRLIQEHQQSKEANDCFMVDCDDDPSRLRNLEVHKHRRDGLIKLNIKQITLYYTENQRDGLNEQITPQLLEKLDKMNVLNANVLDYLLANQYLIPEEWKNKYIFFWGTIYGNPDNGLWVRYLKWCDYGEWGDDIRLLSTSLGPDFPAAMIGN